jgi:hypothetical protein
MKTFPIMSGYTLTWYVTCKERRKSFEVSFLHKTASSSYSECADILCCHTYIVFRSVISWCCLKVSCLKIKRLARIVIKLSSSWAVSWPVPTSVALQRFLSFLVSRLVLYCLGESIPLQSANVTNPFLYEIQTHWSVLIQSFLHTAFLCSICGPSIGL